MNKKWRRTKNFGAKQFSSKNSTLLQWKRPRRSFDQNGGKRTHEKLFQRSRWSSKCWAPSSSSQIPNIFVNENGTKSKALPSIVAYIDYRSSKCPLSKSHETRQAEFLKNVLIKESWEKPILIEIKDGTNFQQLYTKLAKALHFLGEPEWNQSTSDKYDGKKSLIFFTNRKCGCKISGKRF